MTIIPAQGRGPQLPREHGLHGKTLSLETKINEQIINRAADACSWYVHPSLIQCII